MANSAVKISELPPAANAITGPELLSIVQAGITSRTTVAAAVNAIIALARGAANGVAPLGADSRVPGTSLPIPLSAMSGISVAADRLPYFTGGTTAATTVFTSFARSLLNDVDAAEARATLGAVWTGDLGSGAYAVAEQMPFVNLMPDSGRYCGVIDPQQLRFNAGTVFQNSAVPFINLLNGTTVASAGQFIYDNSTNGGAAGALETTVSDLLVAMGRGAGSPRRYGTEFFVAEYTMGSGTTSPLETDTGTTWEIFNNAQVAMYGNQGRCTFVGWVRASGANPVYFTNIVSSSSGIGIWVNGVRVTDSSVGYVKISPADGWVHIRKQVQSTQGYGNDFPRPSGKPGDKIQIACPAFYSGAVDVGLHYAPLSAVNPLSGRQLAAMPISGGQFTNPPQVPEYTLVTMPSAPAYKNGLAVCTNATGGRILVISDGTNWLRTTDRTVLN